MKPTIIKNISSILILLLLYSCNSKVRHNKPTDLDMFIHAYTNNSTSPDYVLVNVTDLNTMEIKTICLENYSLINVYENEIGNFESYDSLIKCSQLPISIKLKNKGNLKNLNFYEYNIDSLNYYSSFINDSIIKFIKNEYKPNPNPKALLQKYIKPNIYIIHHLFNNGIICARDCISGYILIRDIKK